MQFHLTKAERSVLSEYNYTLTGDPLIDEINLEARFRLLILRCKERHESHLNPFKEYTGDLLSTRIEQSSFKLIKLKNYYSLYNCYHNRFEFFKELKAYLLNVTVCLYENLTDQANKPVSKPDIASKDKILDAFINLINSTDTSTEIYIPDNMKQFLLERGVKLTDLFPNLKY